MAGNRLGHAASAYLQSAAHQPVHWYPWGAEAFATARDLDRPILLDIGAVWCHWCHVMDGESYEDPALAEWLNTRFVCVKVDRDERPDVDARYQRAVQSFTGQGGWPLTAFLTPAGDVFYGGTYFPPDGRYGRPGFRSVLERVSEVYRGERDRVEAQGGAIRQMLARSLDETAPGEVTPAVLEAAVGSMRQAFDAAHGGFGSAPKFPHPAAIRFLLGYAADHDDQDAEDMALANLTAMARGGIHDHLGGGFHRYSTDAQWIVPHFEKMAYDNAGLLQAYVEGVAWSGDPAYERAAAGIVQWIREVLALPDDGFGASQDADVGLDDDGDYFTWTLAESAAVLDERELAVAAAYFDIGTAGEMHHNPSKNVLYVAASIEEVAGRTGLGTGRARELLESALTKLRAARDGRESPFVDRTPYTSWNAMVAAALLRAAPILDDDEAGRLGIRALERIRREAPRPDAVGHTPGASPTLLDDQVQVALAALEAAEFTGEASWADWAGRIMARAWDVHADPAGGLFDTVPGSGGEGLLPEPAKAVQDAPTPGPNAVAAVVCARLAEWNGDLVWAKRRDALVRAFGGRAAELGLHGATLLSAVDWALNPATHMVITGAPDDPVAREMYRTALAAFAPRRVVRWLAPDEDRMGLPRPLVAMLDATAGGVRGYACAGATCQAPAASLEEWRAALRSAGARLPARWGEPENGATFP